MTTATAMIAAERERQIHLEGYSPEDDDYHVMGELGRAAACYMAYSRGIWLGGVRTWWATPMGWVKSLNQPRGTSTTRLKVPKAWPWSPDSWKPDDDPLRNYVKAGALLAAEMDRIMRLRDRAQEPGF